MGYLSGPNPYAYVNGSPVQKTDPLGLIGWPTLDLPATPSKCALVNSLLDTWAVGHNQTLLDHWRGGSGTPLTFGFEIFDPVGHERMDVYLETLKRAGKLGAGLGCNESTTGTYNLARPRTSNRHSYYISPMIYGWQFWWECSLTAKKVCKDDCCVRIDVRADCKYHARDTVDFWNNSWDLAFIPPFFIKDRLVRACNPKGRGFQVSAEASDRADAWADCKTGQLIYPVTVNAGELVGH